MIYNLFDNVFFSLKIKGPGWNRVDPTESVINWPPGSGSVSQDNRSANPDPNKMFTNPQHWFKDAGRNWRLALTMFISLNYRFSNRRIRESTHLFIDYYRIEKSNKRATKLYCSQIHSPCLGDIVGSRIELSYRTQLYALSQGLRIWLRVLMRERMHKPRVVCQRILMRGRSFKGHRDT